MHFNRRKKNCRTKIEHFNCYKHRFSKRPSVFLPSNQLYIREIILRFLVSRNNFKPLFRSDNELFNVLSIVKRVKNISINKF
jgi:hypothetical protein